MIPQVPSLASSLDSILPSTSQIWPLAHLHAVRFVDPTAQVCTLLLSAQINGRSHSALPNQEPSQNSIKFEIKNFIAIANCVYLEESTITTDMEGNLLNSANQSESVARKSNND